MSPLLRKDTCMQTADERGDEELMQHYQQGESSALEALVRRHADPLLGFLTRMTGDRAAAEDLFQETFLRVHRKASSFRSGSRFKSWLYAIAAHLAIDRRRRTARAPTLSLDAGEEDRLIDHLPDPTPGPDVLALDADRHQAVRAALEDLAPRQRATLVLAFFEGLSYPEVATAMGCTVGTVKTQVSRALHILAQRLPDPRGDAP